MFPAVPNETTRADRVANREGPNQEVMSFKGPIRLQAIPVPISALPKTNIAVELPMAGKVNIGGTRNCPEDGFILGFRAVQSCAAIRENTL